MLRSCLKIAQEYVTKANKRGMRKICIYQNYTTVAYKADNHSFKDYSPQDKKKILKLLNKANLNELLSYELTGGCADKLIEWKEQNGKIKTIQDVLLIDGICESTADQIFKSLLKESTKKSPTGKAQGPRIGSFTTPSIDAAQRMTLKSCLSLHIGVSSITWARVEVQSSVNEPSMLTHWHHYEMEGKKMHISDLIRHCQYVDHLIPTADCYLFEDAQMVKMFNNPESVEQSINIQKAQITAVLSHTLLSRNKYKITSSTENRNVFKDKSNIFFLRRFLTARLFNHLVGTEYVSSEKAVLDIIRTCETNQDLDRDFVPNVNEYEKKNENDTNSTDKTIQGTIVLPSELISMFSQAERFQRDFLGKVLLLNLAFIRLVLLQDPDSLALVVRNSNKKTFN